MPAGGEDGEILKLQNLARNVSQRSTSRSRELIVVWALVTVVTPWHSGCAFLLKTATAKKTLAAMGPCALRAIRRLVQDPCPSWAGTRPAGCMNNVRERQSLPVSHKVLVPDVATKTCIGCPACHPTPTRTTLP
jgi:hypothetical protein